ncbi:MAG: hypothetical protein K2P90_00550 [Holosporales bacterium]|nr:hypothetical protein [Holosporales bacterium]
MKCVLFFISYLGGLFLESQGFAHTISYQLPPIEKGNSQEANKEANKEEEEEENSTSVKSQVLPDGRKVLRIKNGTNDQQSIVQTDASGNMEEIVKTTSARSRKFVHQTGPQVISGGNYTHAQKLDEDEGNSKLDEDEENSKLDEDEGNSKLDEDEENSNPITLPEPTDQTPQRKLGS